jgi:hypothetical protein
VSHTLARFICIVHDDPGCAASRWIDLLAGIDRGTIGDDPHGHSTATIAPRPGVEDHWEKLEILRHRRAGLLRYAHRWPVSDRDAHDTIPKTESFIERDPHGKSAPMRQLDQSLERLI